MIEEISIENFRNLKLVQLELDEGLNIIEGDNAQGKTNLLEAIYFLANGQSFRLRDYESLIYFKADCAILQSKIKHQDLISDLDVLLTRETKEIKLQGKIQKRLAKIGEILRVLVFTPDSTTLFRSTPALRRRYFDLAMEIYQPAYGTLLRRYTRVVRQRNSLLESRASQDLLIPFDLQWADLSKKLMEERNRYLQDLTPYWQKRLRQLSPEYGELIPSWKGPLKPYLSHPTQELLEKLEEKRAEERRYGRTALGPHRDDMEILLQSKPIREIASQGQQRMLVMALKLAEADLFREKNNRSPVFLLDDIGSELDQDHMGRLLEILKSMEAQTLLTSARGDYVAFSQTKTFRVTNGRFTT